MPTPQAKSPTHGNESPLSLRERARVRVNADPAAEVTHPRQHVPPLPQGEGRVRAFLIGTNTMSRSDTLTPTPRPDGEGPHERRP